MRRLLMLTVATLAVLSVSLLAAKDVFQRTKPHVNVGMIGNRTTQLWIHSTIVLRAEGTASGEVQFKEIDGENYFYRVTGAEAIVARDDVVGLDVTLARVGEGGDETGEVDRLMIRRSSTSEDCLIYDLVGANVHIETEGIIATRDPIRP